mmetsp:Transcript_33985/g.38675  ORF Transcript_33985/g.38675 Transcript_33985/m.38675 type:complete len:322 (+) Transcript_33985:40-1005(+)|eukprot:CAMPEP_0194193946 /NCGR_PEP_ID=MMETSP0154-20130528/75313_1 /TAXON_ID=1049557 /ORGANISM="Thalassiothrix antarctica, Strain L6-D1" /LENGTH=321 /DNA_ID=CAMNT_0038918327 /DNA_START=61 /DNA_END=1026 /DNA_ORIENTATION=-
MNNINDTGIIGMKNDHSKLRSLVTNNFPPVCYAFGYGSGVFEQEEENNTNKQEKKMIDLIFVVESVKEFHTELLSKHSNHYSLLCRLGGPKFVTRLNHGGVFFHPYVKLDTNTLIEIKYGIVEKKVLLDDLMNWTSLYLAGRLHKPTLSLIDNDEIRIAQENHNLPNALATALLLLKEKQQQKTDTYSLSSLFRSVAQLSYMGDARLDVGGEDPDKIRKLVHGNADQFDRFRNLYEPSINRFVSEGIVSTRNNEIIVRNEEALRQQLPLQLRTTGTNLVSSINKIVRRSSRSQSLKGIVTAGIFKSTRYAIAKLSKGLLKK